VADQPESALFSKVKDLGRAKRRTAFGAAAGLIPTIAAARSGGPAAASETAKRFIPQPGKGPNIQAAVELKKGIVDSMVDANAQNQDSSIKLADKLKGQNTVLEKVLALAGDVFGSKATATASSVGSYNTLTGVLNKALMDSVMEHVKSTNPSGAGGVEKAFNDITAALGPEGLQSPNLAEGLNRQLTAFRAANNGAAADALMAMVEAYAAQKGVSIKDVLAGQAEAMGPDSAAGDALSQINAIGDTYLKIADEGLKMSTAQAQAALRDRKLYSPDMGDAAEFVATMMGQLGVAADPRAAGAVFDEALKKMPGFDSAGKPVDAYLKLLEQVDSDKLQPGGTIWEARQRLIGDPAFKAWMQQRNISDPGVAIKELRRLMQIKQHQQRQESRAELRLQRREQQEGIKPRVPSASADLASGADGPDQRPGTGSDVTFVWSPDGHPQFYGEDGVLRDPTPEELDELDANIQSSGDPDAAFKTLIAPVSRWHELKAASGKVTIDEAGGQAEDAAGRVSRRSREIAVGIKGPGAKEVIGDITYGIAHPGRTAAEAVQKTQKKLRDRMRDKRAVNTIDAQLDEALNPAEVP
jgi:hypothetical protein